LADSFLADGDDRWLFAKVSRVMANDSTGRVPSQLFLASRSGPAGKRQIKRRSRIRKRIRSKIKIRSKTFKSCSYSYS
jgi:hypothetical protein